MGYILDDFLKLGASIPIKREDGDALPKGKSPVHSAIERRDKGDHIVCTDQ